MAACTNNYLELMLVATHTGIVKINSVCMLNGTMMEWVASLILKVLLAICEHYGKLTVLTVTGGLHIHTFIIINSLPIRSVYYII